MPYHLSQIARECAVRMCTWPGMLGQHPGTLVMHCKQQVWLMTEALLQAVRAMRFDAGANRKKLETAESARDRVIAEEELAKAMEEDNGL